MRRLIVCSVLVVSVLALGARADAMTSSSTVDGDATPAVGTFLGQVPDPPTDAVPLCSGPLVSPTVVVTASHCVALFDDVAISRILVSNDPAPDPDGDGIVHLASLQHLSSVRSLHLNPGYKEAVGTDRYREDVSAVVVADPAALSRLGGVAYPQLPSPGVLDRLQATKALATTPFTVMGYGTEQKADGGPPAFPDSGQRRSAVLYAGSLNPQWVHQSQKVKAATGGACYGDSGGPSFLGGPSDRTLVAVTSTGDIPCWSTNVASRVDRASVLAFLAPILAAG